MALLAGFAISIGGTMYYPIYYHFLGNKDTYFYSDPVRYIGYRPETNDKTITEIPAYSNVVGDLHAHYVDIIWSCVMLSIILAVFCEDKNEDTKKRLINLKIPIIAIILGIQKMTNYWDFPIYLVVILISLLANSIMKYGESKRKIFVAIPQILEIIALEELITLPFSRDLYISATKVFLTHITSPLYKWLVLWAFPILICLIFFAILLVEIIKKRKGESNFIKRVRSLNAVDIYIFIISACAIGLVILPELIYLKDIYSDEYKRANTMFKLTYQGYIMFSIVIGYIIAKIFMQKRLVLKCVACIILIIQITSFGYGINAIKYVTNQKTPQDMSKIEGNIINSNQDDYKAILWIRENISKDDVMLEAADGDYTTSARISVFTGVPTLLGWHGHEWIWRAENYNIPKEEQKRWNDIYYIYNSSDRESVKDLLKQYNIKYIYIGNEEYSKYKNMNVEFLCSLGNIVYMDDIKYKNSPVYIVKVD